MSCCELSLFAIDPAGEAEGAPIGDWWLCEFEGGRLLALDAYGLGGMEAPFPGIVPAGGCFSAVLC